MRWDWLRLGGLRMVGTEDGGMGERLRVSVLHISIGNGPDT